MFKAIIVLGFIYFVGSCIRSVPSSECVTYKTVVEIGGCDKYQCAVRYNDGTKGAERRPLIGDTACVKKYEGDWHWKWIGF